MLAKFSVPFPRVDCTLRAGDCFSKGHFTFHSLCSFRMLLLSFTVSPFLSALYHLPNSIVRQRSEIFTVKVDTENRMFNTGGRGWPVPSALAKRLWECKHDTRRAKRVYGVDCRQSLGSNSLT